MQNTFSNALSKAVSQHIELSPTRHQTLAWLAWLIMQHGTICLWRLAAYVASGQYRNGILFAPAVAEVMVRLILERVMETPAFDPRRFDGTKPHAPDSVIETAHRAPGKDAGFQEWHTGF